MRKHCCVFLCCFAMLGVTHHAHASMVGAKLKQIVHRITAVSSHLQTERGHQIVLQQQLKSAEMAIGQISTRLKTVHQQLGDQFAILGALNKKQKLYEQQRQQQRAALAKQIRASYRLGLQDSFRLKLLLNQESPERIGRTLTYYRYFNLNRVQLIKGLNNTIAALRQTQNNIIEHTRMLQQLQNQQRKQQDVLKQQQSARKRVLTTLSTRIQSQQKKLGAFTSNKKDLEDVITNLNHQYAIQQSMSTTSFAQLTGKLRWPTLGRIVKHFDQQIGTSRLIFGGVLIKAVEGQNVYAIAPGRVVFSDWLPGYGLLLIIDHGNGYMTLYGHNHSLYTKQGDWVDVGKIVASVGMSGGQLESGLYFGIRHDGKPLNPEHWCRTAVPGEEFARKFI